MTTRRLFDPAHPPTRAQIAHLFEALAGRAPSLGFRAFLYGRAAFALDVPDACWATTMPALVELAEGLAPQVGL